MACSSRDSCAYSRRRRASPAWVGSPELRLYVGRIFGWVALDDDAAADADYGVAAGVLAAGDDAVAVGDDVELKPETLSSLVVVAALDLPDLNRTREHCQRRICHSRHWPAEAERLPAHNRWVPAGSEGLPLLDSCCRANHRAPA